MMTRTRRLGYGCTVTAAVTSIACGSASGPTSPTAAARTIVVLGDSLARSPSRASGVPAILQERLNATHPGWTVINQGVSGDTTSDGLRRLDPALASDTGIVVLGPGWVEPPRSGARLGRGDGRPRARRQRRPTGRPARDDRDEPGHDHRARA